MKKNGFTLIELLAVIVILAIIALIAVPIILNIIDDAREKSYQRSVELYASAVRNAVARYQLDNKKSPKQFSDLTIEYDGDVQCDIQKLYSDKTIYLGECTVNDSENKYSYGEKPGCTIAKQDETKYSVGDVVSCELSNSTEKFYVIENEEDDETPETISMLAMYNLNVGDNKYPNEATYGIQDKNVYGYKSGYTTYGTVAFSTTQYWEDPANTEDMNIYNENNDVIKPIIDNYVDYLNKKLTGATGSLLNVELSKNIGFNFHCDNLGCGEGPSASTPEWVYSSTYWYGVALGNNPIIAFTAGAYDFLDGYSSSNVAGVRPVVTISTNDIR